MTANEIIGENIRRKRVLSRRTQEGMAKLLKRSQPHLSKVEAGTAAVTAEELFALAKIFNTTMESFFVPSRRNMNFRL